MSKCSYALRDDAFDLHIDNSDGLIIAAPQVADTWRVSCALIVAALIRDILADGPLDNVTVITYGDDNEDAYVAHHGILTESPDSDSVASIDGHVIEDVESIEVIKLSS